MRLIKPFPVTGSVLASSNVPESEYPVWSSTLTFSLGDRVIDSSVHRIYESLVNSNSNLLPSTHPTSWVEVGPTNRWAMFDDEIGTATSLSGPITVVLTPESPATALALLGVTGHSVSVSMVWEGTTVYDTVIPLTDVNNNSDWYSYFYEGTVARTSVVLMDLPSYSGAEIHISVEAFAAGSAIGMCLIGTSKNFGITQYGASMSIDDYSKKDRDEFGRVTITPREYSKKGRFSFEVPHNQYDMVFQYLASVRSSRVLYVGTDSFESTLIYGFYKSFDAVIPYPTYSVYNLEIEGLI